MNDKGLTVAYVRLSEEDQNKQKDYSESIYNQISLIKSYAKSMGMKISKEYIDDGYTGINFDRPSFEQMKDDIISGLISCVITKDMSRLGRNFIETAYYISEFFPKNNVRYIAINDEFDSNNPNDAEQQIMMEFRSLVNERYVRDTSVKRKHTAEIKTANGEYLGFVAPYGYKIIKKDNRRTLEIDEEAAKVVKRIFEEIAQGKTRHEVAAELNNENITSPLVYLEMTETPGRKYYHDWNKSAIYRIIRNETYTGKIVKRKSISKSYRDKKRDVIPISERETIPNCHPAIITDTLFKIANVKIKKQKKRVDWKYPGFFENLVICGECGKSMTPSRRIRNGKTSYRFECGRRNNREECPNRSIADSKLVSIVSAELKELIETFVDADEISEKAAKDFIKEERPNRKIADIEKSIEAHNINIRNLYMQKTNGEISLDEFLEKKKTETFLKENLEKLLRELIESKNETQRKAEMLEKYNNFINNDNFIKNTVNDLIESITVYKDNTLKITFKFGLSEPKKIKLY